MNLFNWTVVGWSLAACLGSFIAYAGIVFVIKGAEKNQVSMWLAGLTLIASVVSLALGAMIP